MAQNALEAKVEMLILKAYLEHNIELNLIADKYPDAVVADYAANQ